MLSYTVNLMWVRFDTSTDGAVGFQYSRIRELPEFTDCHEAIQAANEWCVNHPDIILEDLECQMCILDDNGRVVSYVSNPIEYDEIPF